MTDGSAQDYEPPRLAVIGTMEELTQGLGTPGQFDEQALSGSN
jgi:hypothetical protein